jgi:hypothetical protein
MSEQRLSCILFLRVMGVGVLTTAGRISLTGSGEVYIRLGSLAAPPF